MYLPMRICWLEKEVLKYSLGDVTKSKKVLGWRTTTNLNDGIKNCAVRLSEYESIYTVLKLSGKVDWVWIDFFSRFPLNSNDINLLKREKFKLCLVSPELQGYSAEKEIPKIINILGEDINKIDAVCSKQIELWKT